MSESSYNITFRVSGERLAQLTKIAETLDPPGQGRRKKGVSVHDVARMLLYEALDERKGRQQLLDGQEFLAEKLDEVFSEVKELRGDLATDIPKLAKLIKERKDGK